MLGMGRRRTKHKDLPPGVRLIKGRYYWRPTSRIERDARKAKGLPMFVPLGADPTEMRRAWVKLALPPEQPEGTVAYLIERYRDEELDRRDPKTKEHVRVVKTRKEYRRQLAKLEERFGVMKYARNAIEASQSGFLRRMDIVQFLRNSPTPVQANKDVNVLSGVFEHAINCGLTEYNPIAGAPRNEEPGRDREPLPWEVEVITTAASPLLALLIRLTEITGWRGVEGRTLERSQVEAAGIRRRQRETWAQRAVGVDTATSRDHRGSKDPARRGAIDEVHILHPHWRHAHRVRATDAVGSRRYDQKVCK